MAKYINRYIYLQKLIARRDNGEIKIITGSRRCGKSWLLNKIYKDYLVADGVPEENIISVSFDIDEDVDGNDLTNPTILKQYLYSQIKNEEENYYVFLDEIQLVDGFERIANGLNARDNVDVYLTNACSSQSSQAGTKSYLPSTPLAKDLYRRCSGAQQGEKPSGFGGFGRFTLFGNRFTYQS